MSLELNKDQLKNLINLVKNEVNEEDNTKAALAEALGNMFNNDMQLHRVMMMTLMNANQISMIPPVGPFPTNPADTITGAFHGNDSFTGKILTKLKKHATYFGCFANTEQDFPLQIAQQAKDLLEMQTQTVLFNDLDLRFANLAILMELLNRETVNYGEGHFTLLSEKALNGNQPYNRTTLKFFNPDYYGNNYEIVKSVYSYDFKYLYLGNTLSNNISFSNADGTQVIDLPDGLLAFLDNCIQALYKEYSAGYAVCQIFSTASLTVGARLAQIVNTCMEKFDPEENLTHKEKMESILSYVSGNLQYAREIKIHGHRVTPDIRYSFELTDDTEVILFKPEVYTFISTVETHEKKRLPFEFNHIGITNVTEMMENENDNVLLFNFWILNIFGHEFQKVIDSLQNVGVLHKYGRH